MTFQEKLERATKKNNSLLCVGLDIDSKKIPAKFNKSKNPQFEFNKHIIDSTNDLVCAYKLNSAFYEAEGLKGILALKFTCHYLKKYFPAIPVILDAKRGDIDSSNKGYIKFAFDFLQADAVTLHPYLGSESLRSFLEMKDKGFFMLCRTSNPGAGEIQDIQVLESHHDHKKKVAQPLYLYIARLVAEKWNTNGNCMLVVGATYPKELKEIRKIVGNMTILVPGVGAQNGDIKKTLKAGLNSKRSGLIINVSRLIIFAEKPQSVAEKLREEINRYRK